MYEPSDPRFAIIHKFLVRAAETERRMPAVNVRGVKTVWPDIAAERYVDFRPDKTQVTFCKATNKQIDAHAFAQELINRLEMETRIFVRMVLKTAAFRERGPAWSKIAKITHVHRDTVKRRYEQALFDIYCTELSIKFRLGKYSLTGLKS